MHNPLLTMNRLASILPPSQVLAQVDVTSKKRAFDEAGLLFERMLSAIGRDRDSVYTIALSPSRPATTLVAEQDMPLLKALALHHVKLAQPKRLWLMGNATSRALLGLDAIAARGCLHQINHEGINVEAVVSFAPPFLLKNPLRKAAAWADMQALVKGMNS